MIPLIAAGLMAAYQGDQNSKNSYAARESAQRQMDLINSIPLPVLKEYYPELYKQAMQLNPEAETAMTLGPSAMQDISADPKLRQAQMNALAKLQEVGDSGGMTASDKLRMSQMQNEMNANVQGQTGAIQQQMATRGLSGGMSEMVAKQLAAQQGANRQADMGMQAKADAEKRALDAIMQSGQLGGQIGQQDFSQAAQKAQARDAISKFNLANQQDVGMRNVQGRNTAQAGNVQSANNISNLNTGVKNEGQKYNLGLPQQNYNNQMARATGQAAALQQGQQANQQANQQQGQLIGGMVQAGAQYYGGQQALAQNQSQFEQDQARKKAQGGY